MTQPPYYGPAPHGVPAPPPAPTAMPPGGYASPYGQAPATGYPPQGPAPGYPPQGPGADGYPGQAQAPHYPGGYAGSPYAGQQNQFGGQFAGAAQPSGMVCRFCGGFPAVEATVRGHQGMVIMMRFLSLKGPFCRLCGIAVHREMTARTMWQGWWGWASFLITPFTLLYNLVPRSRFNKLPMPQPGYRPPSNPGSPIFLRPGALGLLAPGLVLLLIIIGNLTA